LSRKRRQRESPLNADAHPIGIAAPILAICFRLIQGFALGGEVGPTTAT